MRKTSKRYCRVTVLLFLAISLVIPPVEAGAYEAPISAVKKTDAALRTKITAAWVNESIDKVLMDLADQANVDIVKGPQVTGNVTAKVTGVPLAEALTNILAAHSCTYIATDNMIRVTTLSTIDLAGIREELVSKVYRITYADANEVAASLAGFVSEKGRVSLNKSTSHVAVTDTEKKIKAIDGYIAEVDRQTQQVLVEVKIYEITTREGFDLGSALRAARVIEQEAVGTVNPTTSTTTMTPGYNVTTTENRTENIPSSTTTTVTPGYTTTTTGSRDEQPYIDSETRVRTGTDPFTENVTSTYPGADRTDTTTVQMPGITTTATTETANPYTRTDSTVVTTDPITETTTTVQESGMGYYVPKRGKPFVGASFDRQRGGTLSFSLLDDSVDFEFALNILKKEVESKLLANPRILVLDNETADFGIIREIPYRELRQVAREDPITYTEFKDVGVQLKVTPHIARDGLIKLHVMPEFGVLVSRNDMAVLRGKDNDGRDMYQTVLGVPTVDTRRADTMALIKDGQTIAIGGLRKRVTSKDISKVPLLGDIPLLGNLFKSSSESVEINELVVLITPKIIDSLEPTPAALSEDGENGIPKAFRNEGKGSSKLGKAPESPSNGGKKASQTAERGQEPTLQLAYGYIKARRFDLARETLDSIIARRPNNATAYQYLGYCLVKLGDVPAATRSYLKAVELNPADFEAHKGLGVVYMLKAQRDSDPELAAKAVEHWQISLDIKPDQANRDGLIAMIKAYTE